LFGIVVRRLFSVAFLFSIVVDIIIHNIFEMDSKCEKYIPHN
jgi:hypothetical protein